ncbi:MAG: hypothetical protein WC712_13795 [Candidatus Brocadiia bacterium]
MELTEMLKTGRFGELAALEPTDFAVAHARVIALSRLGKADEARAAAEKLEPHTEMESVQAVLALLDALQTVGRHAEMLDTIRRLRDSGSVDKITDETALFDLVSKRGEIEQMFEMENMAYESLRKAFEIAHRLGDPVRMLISLQGLYDTVTATHREEESGKVGVGLLKIARKVAAESDAPEAIVRAAEALGSMSTDDEAEPAYLRAVEVARQNGWKWLLANALLSYSRFVEFNGVEDSALDITEEACLIFRELAAIPALIMATDQKAMQLANSGRGADAVTVMDTVIEEAAKLNDVFLTVSALSKAVSLAFEDGELDRGLAYLRRIIDIGVEKGIKPPAVPVLLREAYRLEQRTIVHEKLGVSVEDEFGD